MYVASYIDLRVQGKAIRARRVPRREKRIKTGQRVKVIKERHFSPYPLPLTPIPAKNCSYQLYNCLDLLNRRETRRAQIAINYQLKTHGIFSQTVIAN